LPLHVETYLNFISPEVNKCLPPLIEKSLERHSSSIPKGFPDITPA
jgi:hypothetical protein